MTQYLVRLTVGNLLRSEYFNRLCGADTAMPKTISFDEKIIGSHWFIANLALGNADCNVEKGNTFVLMLCMYSLLLFTSLRIDRITTRGPMWKKMTIRICLSMANIYHIVWNATISLFHLPLRDVAFIYVT